MEMQWISMSPAIAQLIVVAMIREGQVELAQAEMDRLHEKGVAIPDWVWTIFIHALCDRGDFEAILELYYTVADQGYLIARPTLLHVLERASSVKEHDLTKYIWRMYVESMHIIPDVGICMHVMRTAAHHTDLRLAESVAIVLESVATSSLPTSSKQSQDADFNGVSDTSSAESNVSTLRAQTDSLAPFEDSRSTDKPGQNASLVLRVESETPLNPEHVSDVAAALPHGPVQDDKASLGANPPAEKELSSASYTTKAAGLAESSITIDGTARHPRTIPLEAQSLLSSVRAARNGSTNHPTNYRRGNLFPMFREDMGLRDARFDPRLAFRRRQDWWLQPVSKNRKNRITISRRTRPRGD
jgi:pentatricopeptide repeat protein